MNELERNFQKLNREIIKIKTKIKLNYDNKLQIDDT